MMIEATEAPFPCPCGKKWYYNVDEETAAVIHEEPRCEAFERLEPDEYAAYVRKHYEARFRAEAS